MTDWRPIDTAPKDGTHILVGDFTPGSIGFGRFAGEIVPTQTVAHWWAARGEEGFYPSVGSVQHFEPLRLTHWRPLPPAPMKLHFTREWLREKIASDPDGEPEAGAAVQPAAAQEYEECPICFASSSGCAHVVRHKAAQEFIEGAVSVVKPHGTEETGNDRPAAPVFRKKAAPKCPQCGETMKEIRGGPGMWECVHIGWMPGSADNSPAATPPATEAQPPAALGDELIAWECRNCGELHRQNEDGCSCGWSRERGRATFKSGAAP